MANSDLPTLTLICRPSCSKSRCLHAYLTDNKIAFVIRDYIHEPLSQTELLEVFEKLQVPPAALLRTQDPACSAWKDSTDLKDTQRVIALLTAHPELLQRPILIYGNRAVICRPFEQALDFLQATGLYKRT